MTPEDEIRTIQHQDNFGKLEVKPAARTRWVNGDGHAMPITYIEDDASGKLIKNAVAEADAILDHLTRK